MPRRAKTARRTVLLVDHSKFAATSLCKIVDWKLVFSTGTDRQPAAGMDGISQQQGIQIDFPKKNLANRF